MFFMDPNFDGTLQQQVQRMVSNGILAGRFKPGDKLPSSRKLADHLSVSRITITLAFSELVSDDYLTSRGRSGYFVSENAPASISLSGFKAPRPAAGIDWSRHLGQSFSGHPLLDKPEDWHAYRYPFIYGQVDEKLFDHTNWRHCAISALGKREFSTVTSDAFERDDPELIKYIATHTLPRRGIVAKPSEILITIGAQNGLWICAQVLLNQRRTAAMENPGYPGLRAILNISRCNVVDLPIDDDGIQLDAITPKVDVIFATPSHQCPTNVTMSLKRRQELLELAGKQRQIIVEDDYEFEIASRSSPVPALKSLDQDGRVIYVGSFSKSLFPGLRLGYIVGSEEFIREARALRTAIMRHPPGHIQRTVASFLSLGHFDALVARIAQRFRQRREVMEEEIDRLGLTPASANPAGGSSFWMVAPNPADTGEIATSIRRQGVLMEPGSPFFATSEEGRRYYRLAYSSIDRDRIPEGLRLISEALKSNRP